MTEQTPLLSVRDLGRSFGGLRAIDDLALDIYKNQVLGIIGPNGAGKTTAINLVSGVIKPDAGSVTFRGDPVTGMATHKLAKRGIVRTFQSTTVYSDQTVEENCLRGSYLNSYPGFWNSFLRSPESRRKEDRARALAADTLKWLGMAHLSSELSGSLPYGYQKMLGLAIALMAEPALLLLDEPVAGLNGKEADRIRETVKVIHQRGIAVAVVDHNMAFMLGLCDYIVVMQQGRKIAEGSPTYVMSDPLVIEAYLGRQHARVAG